MKIPSFKTRTFHESLSYRYNYIPEYITNGYIPVSGMVEGGTSFSLGGSYVLNLDIKMGITVVLNVTGKEYPHLYLLPDGYRVYDRYTINSKSFIIETEINERKEVPINEIKYFIFPSENTIENHIKGMMKFTNFDIKYYEKEIENIYNVLKIIEDNTSIKIKYDISTAIDRSFFDFVKNLENIIGTESKYLYENKINTSIGPESLDSINRYCKLLTDYYNIDYEDVIKKVINILDQRNYTTYRDIPHLIERNNNTINLYREYFNEYL